MLRSQRTGVFGVAILLAGLSFGCVGGSKGLSSEDKEKILHDVLALRSHVLLHRVILARRSR